MKAIIKETQINKEKKIFVTIDRPNWGFTPVKLIFKDELGWVVKYRFFGHDVLTSVELREIAQKLDEYTKGNIMNKQPKWKQQKNSKNL